MTRSGATGHGSARHGSARPGRDIAPGTFTPRPGPAPLPRMLGAQTAMELRLTLRNGEQLLLNLVIPLLLLVVLASQPFLELGESSGTGRRIDALVPGILALVVISAAFTGQAIATGFERKYGVLKRLGATPLPRSVLLGGKTCALAALELLQVALVCAVGYALGWRPHGSPLAVALLIVLGTAAFAGLGLLMAGILRAEATLAAANVLWFLFVFLGGVVFPLSSFPDGAAAVLGYLPSAALADGLRAVLQDGSPPPVGSILTLTGWAVVSLAAASRTFRWE